MVDVDYFKIIDISQPVDKTTACFPGDTPYTYDVMASFADTKCYSVTAFKMSPHVGTHADAAAHVKDKMDKYSTVGALSLEPFIGPCDVVDLSGVKGEISLNQLKSKLADFMTERLLIRTRVVCRYDVFEHNNAYLSVECVRYLAGKGVKLIGVDNASVDATDSKTLPIHHALIAHKISWLENLDLTHAPEGKYFLSALPLKLIDLEAAPVRAVLLTMATPQNVK